MNNQYEYEKVINYGMLSPKIEKSRHLNLNKNKSNLGNYISYSKYTNAITGSPISIYSNKEKINNNFVSDNSLRFRIVSPLQKSRIKLNRSSSQKNMTTRPLSSRNRRLPSVLNNQNNNYNYKSPRNKNSSIIYNSYNSSINESFINKQNFFNLETEKLYQETFQIRKLAKILSKELSLLKKENIEKDKIIDLKEKQINDIILNNISKLENGFKNSNDINYSDENSIISNSNPNLNIKNFTNNGLVNDKNSSISCNDSIYANALSSNRNSSTGNLFLKIKKEVKQTNNEIKLEKEKIDKLKKSLFITKMNELNIESNILESQINKINTLLSIALKIKDKNEEKMTEIGDIQENMSKQEKIIFNLINMTTKLKEEQSELKNKLSKNKNKLKLKIKEVSLNNSKITELKKKNINLSNDKVIKDQSYIININGNPVAMNSLYLDKINKLKGNIKFYKRQIKYSDIEINKLKDRRKKVIDSEKIKALKIESNDVNKNNIPNPNTKINLEINKMSSKISLPENEIISKLRKKLRDSKESEKKLEEKVNLYQKKLKEIDIVKEDDKEEGNQSQIEFGIDNDNPFYIENEDNIPEKSNKFTSSQFNQFTYVLFKNFESKGIVLEESKKKIINPFVEFASRNNLTTVEYPSNNFDFISEEFTKIILKVLNCDNLYNHILTKIFISALFYNSECDINKLIEYFNVLFSYTRNYSIDEEKYINKLKNKYKEQTKKLVSCISHYINSELNSSSYFPLLKMKELLDQNDINLKDKYIEFLFYYMKKFNDPDSRLGDLKFSLLNNILHLEDGNINIINRGENEGNNLNVNINEEQTNVGNLSEEDNLNKNIELTNNKEDSNIIAEMDKNNNKKHSKNGIKTPTEVDYSKRRKKKNNTDKNENSDDYEEDEDSMTEITNEEYIKQLTEAICMMQKGLKEANTNFNDLMTNVIQKRKINGIFYECITIEDFNDQLKSINIVLTDLKLSCLCSKYSIPNELRLIDKNKIEKDIEDQIKATLKLEEDNE